MRFVQGLVAVALILGPAGAAWARDLVIVTSFPKELFETYKKAFEAKTPGVKVVINSKPTPAAVTYVRETRARPEADLFWASSPDAFVTLKGEGLLEKHRLPTEIASRIPAKVGAFPIHDPDGFFFGFAISGYGLMWNKPYLKTHRLPEPKEWTDLADPRYFGHVVSTSPSRSGTTHITVEVILQAYGWEKGWALLMNASGNMGSIPERSFGVPEAVNTGQSGIGVVIDFFGLSAIASGFPVDFHYPSQTSVVPANVAVLKAAPNAENARAFVNFLLSDDGQLMLFSKEIARLPVVPALYARAPAGYPNPFQMKLGGLDFDQKLSSGRRNVVLSLFDQIITFRHAELRLAWGSIYKAEEALAKARAAGKSVGEAEGLVREARALATRAPIDAKTAGDKKLNQELKDRPEVKAKLEIEWDSSAKANYARAKELADRAVAQVR